MCVTVACTDVLTEVGLVAAATQFALAATVRHASVTVRRSTHLQVRDAVRASPLVAAREILITAATI